MASSSPARGGNQAKAAAKDAPPLPPFCSDREVHREHPVLPHLQLPLQDHSRPAVPLHPLPLRPADPGADGAAAPARHPGGGVSGDPPRTPLPRSLPGRSSRLDSHSSVCPGVVFQGGRDRGRDEGSGDALERGHAQGPQYLAGGTAAISPWPAELEGPLHPSCSLLFLRAPPWPLGR